MMTLIRRYKMPIIILLVILAAAAVAFYFWKRKPAVVLPIVKNAVNPANKVTSTNTVITPEVANPGADVVDPNPATVTPGAKNLTLIEP